MCMDISLSRDKGWKKNHMSLRAGRNEMLFLVNWGTLSLPCIVIGSKKVFSKYII